MSDLSAPAVSLDTRPDRYRHWKLSVDGDVATLSMDVREDGGLSPGYRLKLNSYDLGVDIELADAVQRIRFEHPRVRVVVIDSSKDRIFCAGANIVMLRESSHAWKVNFCKFTNETRLAIEDASQHSGLKFIAAVQGTCAGGGYELALACDEILLVDDGHSAVSLPEVPLLGVLPGTGGLTRLVDKRRVRRDRADYFSTLVEGIKGKRAVEWNLVDAVLPASRFREGVRARALALAALSDRPADEPGIALGPIAPDVGECALSYSTVSVAMNREQRTAELVVRAPADPQPSTPSAIVAAGDRFWPLRAFRELDDALLRLRLNEPAIGVIVIRTQGDQEAVLGIDRTLAEHQRHWAVREVILLMKRVLKRLDLTARSTFASIEPGSAFAGSLFELALAADRAYMLHDDGETNVVALSAMNAGLLPMSNGLSRLETRLLASPGAAQELVARTTPFDAAAAEEAGLVLFAPDEIDWEDELRLAIEARSTFSPDALTGLEANLRSVGPETMETKIFGRLSAWQNWIFQRPNAAGANGALQAYGRQGRPDFDWTRT